MKRLIDKLRHYHILTGEEYANLLSCQDTGTLLYLQQQAREVTLAHFGNGIFIRGLIVSLFDIREDVIYFVFDCSGARRYK